MSSLSILQGALWTAARRVLNLGTVRPQVKRAADLRAGERVVDVGCGTGEMAPIVGSDCSYLGVDLSDVNIRHAQAWYGRPNRTFRVLDVTSEPLPQGPYDVGLMISVLHHMSEPLADAVLSQLAPQVSRRVVLVDLLALDGHPLQRLLVSLDQGEYPRSLWDQRAIVERHLEIEDLSVFSTRSGSASLSLFVCRPRRMAR